MPDIEPFKFQKSTNIEEHNQMKDKINEMVEVINDIDLENLPSQIGALETEVAAQGNEIDALEVTVNAIPNTYAKKTEIPDVSDFITDDALTPYAKIVDVDNADVTGVDASINNGEITIKLTRPDGDMSDSIDCPFIQTATLIPTSTARAFKIRFTYTDGTQYDTNEFIIPEGGGTDVSVTGVTVGDGTAPNSFKVTIQLSDTTTIGSNDYVIEFPENINTYPTTLTASLSGTTLSMTIGLNDGSSVQGTANLSTLLTGYATTSYVDTQVATKLDKATADGYYQPKGDYVTEPAVETLSSEIINGNTLKIDVNDKSTQVALPSSGTWKNQLYSDASQFADAFFNLKDGAPFIINYYVGSTITLLFGIKQSNIHTGATLPMNCNRFIPASGISGSGTNLFLYTGIAYDSNIASPNKKLYPLVASPNTSDNNIKVSVSTVALSGTLYYLE